MLPDMKEADSHYLKPKSFARWFAVDYFRQPGRLAWLKWRLIQLAFVLPLLWLGWYAIRGDERPYQSGPVSSTHADFAADCSRCHTGTFQPVSRLWNPQARSVPDGACAECHAPQALRPIHHEQAVHVSCATCHREHRGRLALARVPDGHCTSCHANLQRLDGQPSAWENVSGFAGGHPEFGVLRRRETDRANLHFNHAVHLKQEGVLGLHHRPVKLNCQDCHQPEVAGCYLRPVNYQRHCASCHPLAVQVVAEDLDRKTRTAAEHFGKEPAPHKEPKVVQEALRARYDRFARDHPAVLSRPVFAELERPFPGKQSPEAARGDHEAWVEQQREVAERVLFVGAGGCRYCHVPKPGPRERLPEYEPTNIPSRWLPHGSFNHAEPGHRKLDCTACHAAPASRRTADVLIPGVASCQECHAPRGEARSDCAECHRYHSGPKHAGKGFSGLGFLNQRRCRR